MLLESTMKLGSGRVATLEGDFGDRVGSQTKPLLRIEHAAVFDDSGGGVARVFTAKPRDVFRRTAGESVERGRAFGKNIGGLYPDQSLPQPPWTVGRESGGARTGSEQAGKIEAEPLGLKAVRREGGKVTNQVLEVVELSRSQRQPHRHGLPTAKPERETLAMMVHEVAEKGGMQLDICHRETAAANGEELVAVFRPDEDQGAFLQNILTAVDEMAAPPLINPEEFGILMGVEAKRRSLFPGKPDHLGEFAGLRSPGEKNHRVMKRSEEDIKMSTGKMHEGRQSANSKE